MIWRRGKIAPQWRCVGEYRSENIDQSHTGLVTQMIREVRENKGDLVELWLDFTNVHSYIPHKLVEVALNRHHVPGKIRDLILDYYNSYSLRVFSGTKSEWISISQ